MAAKLSLKPVASRLHNQEDSSESAAPTLFEVEGLPGNRKVSIRLQPAAQQSVWQIGAHTKGYNTRWNGTFESASEALAQLQEQIDSAEEEPVEITH